MAVAFWEAVQDGWSWTRVYSKWNPVVVRTAPERGVLVTTGDPEAGAVSVISLYRPVTWSWMTRDIPKIDAGINPAPVDSDQFANEVYVLFMYSRPAYRMTPPGSFDRT